MMHPDVVSVQSAEDLPLQDVPDDSSERAVAEPAAAAHYGRLLLWARWGICTVGFWLVAAGVWLENRLRRGRTGLRLAG